MNEPYKQLPLKCIEEVGQIFVDKLLSEQQKVFEKDILNHADALSHCLAASNTVEHHTHLEEKHSQASSSKGQWEIPQCG